LEAFCSFVYADLVMKDAKKFTVGLVQMAMSTDADENLQRAVERVEEAAKQGAEVVCLPELFRSQYFCQREDADLFDLAESIPGPSTEALSRVAKEKKVTIVASLFERRAVGLYHNTVAYLNENGEVADLYRKMHIPDDPAYYEKFYFTPGDLGFKAFDARAGRIGTLICWDQWYPEGARLTALRGANVLFYPTAIGWHPQEQEQYGAADHSTQPCNRQRPVCCGGQSRRPREMERDRGGHRVLGHFVSVRPVRGGHGSRLDR
jgi:N-carbamoylputrescine amidase